MTTVCTATGPSICGKAMFLLGTYHNPGSAEGQVHITTPSGVTKDFSFNSYCSSSATITSGRYSSTRICPEPDMRTNCPTSVLPGDAYVSCYKYDAIGNSVYTVSDTCDAMPGGSSYGVTKTQYYAIIDGATTGTYSVKTSGTNVDLDPCDGFRGNPVAPGYAEFPCAMHSAHSYSFPLSIAACGGSEDATLDTYGISNGGTVKLEVDSSVGTRTSSDTVLVDLPSTGGLDSTFGGRIPIACQGSTTVSQLKDSLSKVTTVSATALTVSVGGAALADSSTLSGSGVVGGSNLDLSVSTGAVPSNIQTVAVDMPTALKPAFGTSVAVAAPPTTTVATLRNTITALTGVGAQDQILSAPNAPGGSAVMGATDSASSVTCGGQTLPDPATTNINPTSITGCAGKFEGFICPAVCLSGYSAFGRFLACRPDGTWTPDFICAPVDAPRPPPSPPSPPPGTRSSLAVAQVRQDPHFTLAHGGKADFRGNDKALYSFLSSRNVSLNIKTENATFNLGKTTVHGSFMTEAHLAMLTAPSAPKAIPRWFNVSIWASELNGDQWSWRLLNGTCGKVSSTWGGRKVSPFVIGPHNSKSCDNLKVTTELAKVTIETPEWEVTIFGRPVYGHIDGPQHRIDIELAQKKSDAEFVAKPHGLVGQSFDGDDEPRHGRVDVYPPLNASAEFTTSAMAEGAIDGIASDYEMKSPYDTHFKFSAFGAGPSADQVEPWWERRRRRLREQRRRLSRAQATERTEATAHYHVH